MTKQTDRYRSGPGYEHDHFAWSARPQRKPLTWPDGARLALAVFLYFEYFELVPPKGSYSDPRFTHVVGEHFPELHTFTRREYGNRIGVFRVLEVLEKHGITATICANAEACRRYPYLVKRFLEGGHSFVAHGLSARRMITSLLTEEQERAHIVESLAAVELATGVRPTGWAGQDFGETDRTPLLLGELGLTHLIDWPNDDQPYLMNPGRPLVSIPNQTEWDDGQLFAVRKVDAWTYPDLIQDAFETLYDEGGNMLGIGLHPWIIGQSHRIRYLNEALERINRTSGVWQATSDEIADWAVAQLGGLAGL